MTVPNPSFLSFLAIGQFFVCFISFRHHRSERNTIKTCRFEYNRPQGVGEDFGHGGASPPKGLALPTPLEMF